MHSVHSITALRKALRLFRTAAHANDDERAGEESSDSALRLASSPLHGAVVRFAIASLPAAFAHHLPPVQGSMASHARFKVLGPLLKSYLTSFLHLLSSQHDARMTRALLTALLERLVPWLEPFHRLAHRALKQLLLLWSTADRSTRIDAFLCIRAMCLGLSRHGVLEEAMKGIYLTYVQHARWVTRENDGVLAFMANCIVELYNIDPALAYQHGFVYIRQLAIHLRNATQPAKPGGEGGGAGNAKARKGRGKGGRKGKGGEGGYRLVYHWQFVNCLRVWTKVLSSPLAAQPVAATAGAASMSASLRPLLYPFVQVCLGVASLLPSSRYHPLRLVVCGYLADLLSSCHVFVPVLPVLLSLFSSAELTRRPSGNAAKAPELRYVLRVSSATASSRAYQERLCSAALRLITRVCTALSYSLAYCELILPTTRVLRRWAKATRIHRLRKDITAVVTQLEHNADWSRARRDNTAWTPLSALQGHVDGLNALRGTDEKDALSPLERYATMERGKGAGDGEGEVDEADMDWDGSKTKGRSRGGAGDDGDEEEDGEEGEGGEDGDALDDEEDMMDMEGLDDGDEDDGEEERPQQQRKSRSAAATTAKKSAKEATAAVRGRPKKRQQTNGAGAAVSSSASKATSNGDWSVAEDIVTELVLSDDEDD